MGRLKSFAYLLSVPSAFLLLGASPLSAQISLTKSVNVSSAALGAPLTYILNYSNANTNTTCSDTFEGDTLGAQPTAWTNSGGTWTTIADNGPSDSGTKAVQGVAAANTYPNFLNACAGQVGDGSIQADMKITAGTTGVLLWRFTGSNTPAVVNGSNYQADIAVGNANNVSVNYYDFGTNTFQNVATASFTIATGTWYTVLFQVVGSGTTATLALSINGTQVIVPTASNFAIGSGQAGLQSNSGSTVAFDNVSIIKLPQTYNVTVTDTLPVGLTYVSSSGSPAVTGQQVVWSLGNLASGASGALTVSGTVNNCGVTLANTGEVNSGLPFASVISSAVTTTIAACTPTPSDTPTSTFTPTPTYSPTPSATLTATSTATFTSTNSPTPSTTNTGTNTATSTITSTATNTVTSTVTGTATLTDTNTATSTATETATDTSSGTATPTPTLTPTSTPTYTHTSTASATPTDSDTATSTPTGTATVTVTNTTTPTATNTFTETATDTASDTATSTATPTSSSTATDTRTSTATATSTDSFTGTPTNTASSTDTGTATLTATNTATTTTTNTFTETATDTPSNTPTPTATYTGTSTATATFTDTFIDTATNTPTSTPTETATLTATNTLTSSATSTPTNSLTDTATETATNTDSSTATPMATSTPTSTATDTGTFTATPTDTHTNTATDTATLTFTGTATLTVTETSTPTPSSTATGTATPTTTSSVTATFSSTPSQITTPTATPSANGTSTFTPTHAGGTAPPTFTATSSPTYTPPAGAATFTPTPLVTVSCAFETVSLFDQRGELVKNLCGVLGVLNSQNLNLTVSSFAPNASGLGGTLVFSLNGKTLVTWNTTNNNGTVVPNGFYNLVLTQVFTDGTSVQLQTTVYVGTLSRTTQVQLSAQPNIAYSGGTIRLLGTVEGNPVTGNRVLKLYDTSKELVRTLDMSGGQAVWDLTNSAGQEVASGLYLIVLDIVDPQTGTPAQKVIKVVVLR